MSPVLQLVLLSGLAQTQGRLALSVQLVMEVVQQRGSRPALESHMELKGEPSAGWAEKV